MFRTMSWPSCETDLEYAGRNAIAVGVADGRPRASPANIKLATRCSTKRNGDCPSASLELEEHDDMLHAVPSHFR